VIFTTVSSSVFDRFEGGPLVAAQYVDGAICISLQIGSTPKSCLFSSMNLII
jgi:hypothetical protein